MAGGGGEAQKEQEAPTESGRPGVAVGLGDEGAAAVAVAEPQRIVFNNRA